MGWIRALAQQVDRRAAGLAVAVRDRSRRLVLATATLAVSSPVDATVPAESHPFRDLPIAQYHHTAWTVKQGAPGQITALAQSSDGFLWLATQVGLFRFDGVQFERFAPRGSDAFPTQSVASLYAPRTGGLWVGFRYGVASFLAAGHVVHYDADEGLPTGSVYGFAQTRGGTLWAATYQGLVRFDGARWHAVDAAWKLPGKQARSVFVDRDDTLWVATDTALARLPAGGRSFERLARSVGRISQIAQAPDGSVWIAEADGAVRQIWHRAAGVVESAPAMRIASAGLLFDRHGSLWATSLGEGIHRVPYPARMKAALGATDDHEQVEHFREDHGLTSDYLWPALEDREGNLWFGTSRGLDRFRRSNVTQAALPDGSYDFAIAAGDAGSLWVGTKNRRLMRIADETVHFEDVQPAITSTLRDARGELWFGGPGGIWHRGEGTTTRVAQLPSALRYSGVQAMARADDGVLWVSLNLPGVFQWREQAWRRIEGHAKFPPGSSPLTLLATAGGNLWLGFARNHLVRMRGEDVESYSGGEGLDVGNVTALAQVGDTLWIGGERGLAHHDGRFVRTVVSTPGSPLRGISGIVADEHGDLWLNGAAGVVRIVTQEMARMREDASHHPAVELFDYLDGMPGTPAQLRPLSSAVRGSDGKLWFATSSGVVSIDPRHVLRNPLAPTVVVRAMTADDASVDVSAPVQLPAGTTRLEIDYTALSLSIPELVRFRLRLEGLDADWQDVGTRRRAFYTNPGPGQFRFRVIAANEDGVWNEEGATIAIQIAPRFHQTGWFGVLAALLSMALLRLLYVRRMAQAGASLRARLQERHRERERIARELHDTLLQGFQGLILRFHSIADRLGPDDALRASMESALDRAEGALVEGRDRVAELRAPSEASDDLRTMLLRLGEELGEGESVEFRVLLSGRPLPLNPLVRDDLYRIAREAIFNAFQHAHAQQIEVEIVFGADEFRLAVRDDGSGIDEQVLQAGGKSGHWGLRGMRERAEQIGARFDVWTRPRLGTEVVLRLPCNAAFPLPWERRLRARLARYFRRG